MMTKKEARGMVTRIVGIVLTIGGSGLAGFGAVVWAGAEKVEQVNANTSSTIEIKATHKEDMKESFTRVEKMKDSIQEMKVEQARTSTTDMDKWCVGRYLLDK